MHVYETVLIIKPVLSDPEVADVVEKTKKTISSGGGEIVSAELWGRRKLTHFIGRARDGVYAYFKYKSTPSLLNKLAHDFSISDAVMRDMTFLAQDRKMREKKKKAKAGAAPASASAPAAAPAEAA